jgi:hypothetical protein
MRAALIGIVLIASGLAAQAGAGVNYNSSKSNTGYFTQECAKDGGKVATLNGQTSCTLPGAVSASSSLTAACAKDGGKIIQQGDASTCQLDHDSSAPAGGARTGAAPSS